MANNNGQSKKKKGKRNDQQSLHPAFMPSWNDPEGESDELFDHDPIEEHNTPNYVQKYHQNASKKPFLSPTNNNNDKSNNNQANLNNLTDNIDKRFALLIYNI